MNTLDQRKKYIKAENKKALGCSGVSRIMNVKLYMAYFYGLCGIVTGVLLAHDPVMLSIVITGVVVVIFAVAFITHRPVKRRR